MQSASLLLSLPAEIFDEVIQHTHLALGSEPTEQKFVELRLVCRAFDEVVSREVFPRDRKNQFMRRNNINAETAKWLLLTKTKIHSRDTRGTLAFLHECATFAMNHQSEWSRHAKHTYFDYLAAACHIIVANHGVHAVLKQVVFVAKRGKNPLAKSIRMLRARKSTLRPSMTPVDIHGVMQMAAVLGDSSAIEAMVARGVDMDFNHPVFGCALFAAASNGCLKTVSQLIGLGADPNVRGHLLATPMSLSPERNNTALLVAAERNYKQVANLLAGEPRVCINETGGESRKNALVWAAERGWVDTVQIILARGDADVDSRIGRGEFPITVAVMHDHPEVLALLLKASKTKLTEKRYNGQCPMALALVRGSSRMVRLMLEIGEIDPNEELPYGAPRVKCPHPMPSRGSADGTPLVIAVKNGHANLVETLLNYPGVDPNLVSGSITPLDLAIAEDRAEVVKVFLRHQDKLERSLCALRKPLLHVAAHKGAASVIKMLINCYGADPNTYDDQKQTILCSAISNYQWKVVEYLVQCPAVDVNLAGHSGLGDNVGPNIPLQMAAHQQNYIALGYLMKRDDLDLNWSGVWGTALSIAVETSNQWAMKTLLYDSGVDVNRTSEISPGPIYVHRKMPAGSYSSWGFFAEEGQSGGDSPLLRAVKCDKLEAVQALLENHNVDPNVADSCSRTPLWWASRGGGLRMVRYILSARIKPDINAQDMEGWTPLLCAANNNKDTTTRMLLDLPGIDPNAANKYGWTALHICANYGNMRILEQLISHPRIDVWARTRDGETALDVAKDCAGDAEALYQLERLSRMMASRPDSRGGYYEAASNHL
ncbi:unnamed protein product [Clonostachys rhizophaga]|uniref:Uncharacterized protein n=1 Tax=Clonostachys rhizophaga TaxID=160324 RepID=A0A9N9YFF2_9HYPO|nr:unnamed protein product [Clonostachys rhizophaga]